MRLTIKRKLYGLMICSLLFVAGVSAAGYWGITSIEKTTVEVAVTGAAIRNHVEASTYNDLTRDDISTAFARIDVSLPVRLTGSTSTAIPWTNKARPRTLAGGEPC